MTSDIQDILKRAEELGKIVAEHPIVTRYKQAQQSVAEDQDARRLLGEFNRMLETLAQAEQSGLGVTDAHRTQLENLQTQIMSHIKIKNLNQAQVDFVDLLRKVTQTIHRQVAPEMAGPTPVGGAGASSPLQ